MSISKPAEQRLFALLKDCTVIDIFRIETSQHSFIPGFVLRPLLRCLAVCGVEDDEQDKEEEATTCHGLCSDGCATRIVSVRRY
jgi:hypothetical protein